MRLAGQLILYALAGVGAVTVGFLAYATAIDVSLRMLGHPDPKR